MTIVSQHEIPIGYLEVAIIRKFNQCLFKLGVFSAPADDEED